MKQSSKPAKRLKIAAKKSGNGGTATRLAKRVKNKVQMHLPDTLLRKSAKKTSTHRQRRLPRARKRKMRTGVEPTWGFFLGAENAIAGFIHNSRIPRWTPEYEAMAVHQITTRIENDIRELMGRAFAPILAQSSIVAYDRRLRAVINETVAESLCPGLMARIRSPDETEHKLAVKEYNSYLNTLFIEEPKHAAKSVAFIAKWTTTCLENLFVRCPDLMREIAATFDLWPVNLTLQARRAKGGRHKQALLRTDFARTFLTDLGLNRACTLPTGHAGGAHPVSPVTLAAESLYQHLLLLKRTNPGAFMDDTIWARRLRALPSKMTKKDAARWWKVSQIYLYERWDDAREEFAPLERYLNLGLLDGKKYPYQSRIKSRVIDDALKKSFLALAHPGL